MANGRHLALVQRIPAADVHPVQAKLLGRLVHGGLQGKQDLRHAKAPEGAAGPVVGEDRPSLVARVGDAVQG